MRRTVVALFALLASSCFREDSSARSEKVMSKVFWCGTRIGDDEQNQHTFKEIPLPFVLRVKFIMSGHDHAIILSGLMPEAKLNYLLFI